MLREMDKFTGILLLIQLNPIPVFGAKKVTVHVPYDRKIFIESSIKMVSAQCLLLFLLHTYISVCLHLDNLIALSANYWTQGW